MLAQNSFHQAASLLSRSFTYQPPQPYSQIIHSNSVQSLEAKTKNQKPSVQFLVPGQRPTPFLCPATCRGGFASHTWAWNFSQGFCRMMGSRMPSPSHSWMRSSFNSKVQELGLAVEPVTTVRMCAMPPQMQSVSSVTAKRLRYFFFLLDQNPYSVHGVRVRQIVFNGISSQGKLVTVDSSFHNCLSMLHSALHQVNNAVVFRPHCCRSPYSPFFQERSVRHFMTGGPFGQGCNGRELRRLVPFQHFFYVRISSILHRSVVSRIRYLVAHRLSWPEEIQTLRNFSRQLILRFHRGRPRASFMPNSLNDQVCVPNP